MWTKRRKEMLDRAVARVQKVLDDKDLRGEWKYEERIRDDEYNDRVREVDRLVKELF